LPGGHGGIAVGMQNMSRGMLALSDFQDELPLDVSEPGLTGCVAPACRNCYLLVIGLKAVVCGEGGMQKRGWQPLDTVCGVCHDSGCQCH